MTLSGLIVQLLNGLSDAASLFLVASGLSLIFGVTRVVNFAHGSLYMIGTYLACSVLRTHDPGLAWFCVALAVSALGGAALAALIEWSVLRRLYRSTDLLQLLATFAIVLILRDAALYLWGADDLFAPRVPLLAAAVEILGRRFPLYNLALIVIALAVFAGLWGLLYRTRVGRLVRAATQDREMLGALGVPPAPLFTGVFAAGGLLAALGGALQTPHVPASLSMDLDAVTTAFVVVVIGGLGSIPGALLAAVLIGLVRALCIALGDVTLAGQVIAFPRLTLVVEFVVMALVLAWRPNGLLGRPLSALATGSAGAVRVAPSRRASHYVWPLLFAALLVLPLVTGASSYTIVLATEILIVALYASSLQLLVGPAGVASFGHAAYFGLGAYAGALLFKAAHVPMEIALLVAPLAALGGAALVGAIAVRLSGIYLAMLTLACAQIAWSIAFQWDDVTGGSDGLVGVWPAAWVASRTHYYLVTLILVGALLWFLRQLPHTPFGLALRAARDHSVRAESLGVPTRRLQWLAFVVAGTAAGLAGAPYAFSKGSLSPEVMDVQRSIDALVMVLLGGIGSATGPWFGAALYTWLADFLARHFEYWHAVLGVLVLAAVVAFPNGVRDALLRLRTRFAARAREA
jgi:branched-chain amino acid transport system permease protein